MSKLIELKERLEQVKKLGYWECRYDYLILDHEDRFNRELKKGYELVSISYPSNDQGKKSAFPCAKFKFNKAMEEDLKVQIEIQEEIERHSKRLHELNSKL